MDSRVVAIAAVAGLLAAWVTLVAGQGAPLSLPPSEERPSSQAHAKRARPGFPAAPKHERNELDAIVKRFIDAGDVPGCVVITGSRDRVLTRRAFGLRAVSPIREEMTLGTVFDLASLTKPIVTASSVLLLSEKGLLDLDALVSIWLRPFRTMDKRSITVRMLLTHTSGLPAANHLSHYGPDPEQVLQQIGGLRLRFEPGDGYLYSDVGYIVLGMLVSEVSGMSLSAFASRHLFQPAGMGRTRFRPRDARHIAPTEPAGGRMLRGEVHDPRARRMGGEAGHAGLFATADDLAKFAQLLLRGGVGQGGRVFDASTVGTMWKPDGHASRPRTLAWDVVRVWDPKRKRSRVTFGHGGFTGTYLWLDPEEGRFFLLLSSRLHPAGKGKAGPLRTALRKHALATAFEPPVATGIDVLRSEGFARLAGKRIALLTHDAARDARGRRTVDLLREASEVDLVVLFAPEHGMSAKGEGHIADAVDARTQLPVVALFGPRRAPQRTWLDRVDAVVVDLQDAGVRFYTYASTLLRTMRAAWARGKDVVVLDRPNPLGGLIVEGPVPDAEANDWLHPLAIPLRHGLTLGELSLLAASDWSSPQRPRVVRLRGWDRNMLFDDTSLPW
ncbi:MAG: serine hydrolase, partial [Myxococcota bacterium]